MSRLALQIEPMARHLAVAVLDVEIVGILATRARHADGLLAIFAPAKYGGTAVANLDAEVRQLSAVALVTVAVAPSGRAFVIGFVAGSAGARLWTGRPGKARASHRRNQAVHRRMAGGNTVP